MSQNKLTKYALLIALAMIFSYIEFIIPLPIPVPGIKLGLANIVVVIALYNLGVKDAVIISVIRIVLVGITFGNVSMMLYSLSGGLLSILVMIFGKKISAFSVVGVSILGGIFHNIGQLLLATLIIESSKMLYYMPVLIISGAITGMIIGVVSKSIINKIKGKY